jgi:hypothetical protein
MAHCGIGLTSTKDILTVVLVSVNFSENIINYAFRRIHLTSDRGIGLASTFDILTIVYDCMYLWFCQTLEKMRAGGFVWCPMAKWD